MFPRPSYVALVLASLLASVASAQTAPASQRAVIIVMDTSDAPELADYAKRVQAVAEAWYPRIVAALPGKGFTPADRVTIVFRRDYDGVAATSGDRVVCSVRYFTAHPDDLGAFVHELVHVVQHYTDGDRPGWLVEGIADYVRFFQYEPASNRPHPNPQKAQHTDSYRTTAHFLDWAQRTYDPQLVVTLNEACRTATYSNDLWKQRTGKTLDELGAEWRASLAK